MPNIKYVSLIDLLNKHCSAAVSLFQLQPWSMWSSFAQGKGHLKENKTQNEGYGNKYDI